MDNLLRPLCFKPYGNQDINYYFALLDLPKTTSGYSFSDGNYNPENGTLTYTFNDVDVANENELFTYHLPPFLEQFIVQSDGGLGLIYISNIVVTGNINGKKKTLTAETSTIRQPIDVGFNVGFDVDESTKLPLYFTRISNIVSLTNNQCAFCIVLVRTQIGVNKLLSLQPNSQNPKQLLAITTTNSNEPKSTSSYIVAANIIACSPNQFEQIQFNNQEIFDLVPFLV